MPLRPCLGSTRHPASHTLTDAPGSRCPDCSSQRNTERDAARGTTTQRGYGQAHQKMRAQWAPYVTAGLVDCARCEQRILPGQAWDLGHTDDRTAWTGPEHATQCNRAAGGHASHHRS